MTADEAAVMGFAGSLGQVGLFDESASDWALYEERLTPILMVNRLPENDKRSRLFERHRSQDPRIPEIVNSTRIAFYKEFRGHQERFQRPPVPEAVRHLRAGQVSLELSK
ncbi:hypothetical protein HPB50_015943 [Hyalomma asiaticum]|uniref:Uncharacterized protein n=1 Tax=Hyalomma asiaticum TaxID=266040 RepID=A0ACB7RUF8_HYAAI|nr:hypothetical protein HPB50_015943 [Hyalomma asiaticum]